MLFVEQVIDPAVELILAVGLDARKDEVVRRAGKIRHGVVLQDLLSNGIEAGGRDHVAGKWNARRGRGVVNRVRENAPALRESRHGAESRDAGAQTGTLP